MNTSRTNFSSILCLCMLSFSFPALANDSSTTAEAVGFGGGALLGATLGGPVGAIIGASLGAYFGDANQQLKVIESELAEAQREQLTSEQDVVEHQRNLEKIQRDLLVAEHEIEALHGKMRNLFIDRALVNGLEFSVYFDTDRAEFEDTDLSKLVTLAKLLAEVPELTVELQGFADRRGSDDYNQTLSLDRAYAVADTLVALGVDKKQLRTFAFGETRTYSSGVEDLQKDRRVNLKVGILESIERLPNSDSQVASSSSSSNRSY